jgi:RHS repeat-associated protein
LDNTTTVLSQVLGDGTNSYLYGLGRIGESGGGVWQYPLSDALGSARQLTDPSGDLTLTQYFEPFGSPLKAYGDASSEFGFTGEQDGIGNLVFLRARYYDPGTGRFITKDPFPGIPSLLNTFHPYQYAQNNPINLVVLCS